MNNDHDAVSNGWDTAGDGEFGQRPMTKWPTVVGTIAIVYACLGLLMQCIALFGTFAAPTIMANLAGMDPVPMPPVMLIGQLVSILAGIALGVMLLLGGIKTLRRRRGGPRLINLWVMLRLVLLVLGLVFGFMVLSGQVEYQLRTEEAVREMMRRNPDMTEETIQAQVPEKDPAEARKTLVVWMLGVSGFIAICPIVLGLVLSSGRRRDEVKAWP